MLNHYKTIDSQFKRVNIYTNEYNEFVLRCFKNGVHVYEWNYHAIDEKEAISESNLFLTKG
jgi:hypothetical protein